MIILEYYVLLAIVIFLILPSISNQKSLKKRIKALEDKVDNNINFKNQSSNLNFEIGQTVYERNTKKELEIIGIERAGKLKCLEGTKINYKTPNEIVKL